MSTDNSAQQRLDELKAMRKEMLRTMQDFDARIRKLEAAVKAQAPARATTTRDNSPVRQSSSDAADPSATIKSADRVSLLPTDNAEAPSVPLSDHFYWGGYEGGRGFQLVRARIGEININLIAYVRYLDQLPLNPSYRDSFGRLFFIDRRQDVLLNKVNLSFRGWLFDPNFSYRVWVWTQNPAMGDPAQVVVGGHLRYHFADLLSIAGGVAPLPTTRSTNWTYPFWLKMDNRTIADEFFRGSYSFGFWAEGDITDDLSYRAMISNNLSALGISASQLPPNFSTYSAALWWMPTTGEFGTGIGFGDYDYHEKVATLFGIHYTQSPETSQDQPSTDAFENSQIRLSDGTLLFSPNAFNNGTQVLQATYHMADANAGVKYLGFSLEAEYYARWVNNFEATGALPVSHLFDQGFQIQASAMIVPKILQAYVSSSKIFGQYGDPWDTTVGLNWYPFARREMHINTEGIYLYRSPVGGPSYPYVVGGTGWLVNTDFIITF